MTPLHWIGQFVREWMGAIPLPVVRGLFIALPVVLLIWVLSLPREATTPPDDASISQGYPPKGHARWTANLKFGASLALILQIVIYALWA